MENIRWMIPSYSQAGAPKHRFFLALSWSTNVGVDDSKTVYLVQKSCSPFFLGSLSQYFPQMFSTSAGGSVGFLNHQQSFNPQAAPDLASKIMRCPYTLPTGPSCLFHHIEFHQTIILPKTNIAPESGWLEYNRFLLGWPIFRCYVSFRECTQFHFFFQSAACCLSFSWSRLLRETLRCSKPLVATEHGCHEFT